MNPDPMRDETRAEIDFSALLNAAIRAKEAQELKKFEEIEQIPEGESLTWIVTPEQIARINAGDRAAIDEFYFEPRNNQHIRCSARAFIRKNSWFRAVASWEDLTQQVYCDLLTGLIKLRPYDKAISSAFYRSFDYAPVGGLDEPFIYSGGRRRCQKQAN